jgi:hypothetical protein
MMLARNGVEMVHRVHRKVFPGSTGASRQKLAIAEIAGPGGEACALRR